jgi:hypothetical protein
MPAADESARFASRCQEAPASASGHCKPGCKRNRPGNRIPNDDVPEAIRGQPRTRIQACQVLPDGSHAIAARPGSATRSRVRRATIEVDARRS